MIPIVIIGSGNVAWHLGVSLSDAGNPPVQIFGRNEEAIRTLAKKCGCQWTTDNTEIAVAELYIIAVSDKAVGKMSSMLKGTEAVVAHTAGSVDIEALSPRIKNRAVIYPLQTLTVDSERNMKDIPFLIEGQTTRALETVRKVAGILCGRIIEADSRQRAMIHLAAVFAGNFTNHMYSIAGNLAREAGMDLDVLAPLITETARKAAVGIPPEKSQTGPAIRNDFSTKSLHCEMLTEKPDLKNIYINLSKNIWETSKKI